MDAARNTFPQMSNVFEEVQRNFLELQIPFETDPWARDVHRLRWAEFLRLRGKVEEVASSSSHLNLIQKLSQLNKPNRHSKNKCVELFYRWVEDMKIPEE